MCRQDRQREKLRETGVVERISAVHEGFLVDQSFVRNINCKWIKEVRWLPLRINSRYIARYLGMDWLLLGSISWQMAKKKIMQELYASYLPKFT